VFNRVFGRAYSKQEDFLFRNECRLLTEKIEKLISQSSLDSEFATNRHLRDVELLRGLLTRKLWVEFESVYHKAVVAAEKACEYAPLIEMEQLYIKHLATRFEMSKKTLTEIQQSVLRAQHWLKQFHLTKEARLFSINAGYANYAHRYSVSLDPAVTVPSPVFEGIKNPMADYFLQKGLAARTPMTVDQQLSEKALISVLQVEGETPFLLYEQMSMMVNLGLAYMLDSKFQAAGELYQQAIHFSQKHQLPLDSGLILNRISMQMRMKDYIGALAELENHIASLSSLNDVLCRAQSLKTFSHLFLREPTAAQQSIPENIARLPESIYYHFRYAHIIIHYLNGNFHNALTEAENFSKRFRRAKASVTQPKEKILIALFIGFIKARSKSDSNKSRPALKNVRAKLETFINANQAYSNAIPALWLDAEIMHICAD
jgi:tetratricopeptide (TPR) repeat protein